MSDYIHNPEARRLMILRGIGNDRSNLQIAEEMGLRRWIVVRDLKTMRFNKDPGLRKAILDQRDRELMTRQAVDDVKINRFKLMTGMSFQEKNFENMVNYYRPELIKILESGDEENAIMDLPRSVQKTLTRNEITVGLRNNHKVSSRARGFLPHFKIGG